MSLRCFCVQQKFHIACVNSTKCVCNSFLDNRTCFCSDIWSMAGQSTIGRVKFKTALKLLQRHEAFPHVHSNAL